eukprot:m.78070 g.78070  ORF g.78070 m.78070 type:complete len:498 (-) comp14098_c0_seq3:70-1563(-)
MHRSSTLVALLLLGAVACLQFSEALATNSTCCKYCEPGHSKACGDSCISLDSHCSKASGCACNGTAPPSPPSDPTYDHQTTTYTSKYKPLELASANLTITPFFSPDHSVDTIIAFIDAAVKTLDIMTPSFSSWSHCTSSSSGCVGCPISTCSGEKFPVFPAILNAVHRGVAVRIITNNFGDTTCAGKISPFDFLALNGVEIRYYTTTTFDHSKFMMRDGKAASISSVNWSRSSYLQNREAGAIIEGYGTDMQTVINFLTAVYEGDWSQSTTYKVTNTYSADDMAIITNPTIRNITLPEGPQRPYVTPKPSPISIQAPFMLWASPDSAYETLTQDLASVQKSIAIYVYQITDTRLCQWVLDAHKQGIKVTLLVSRYIFGAGDQASANTCYATLYNAGVTIHTAWQFGLYTYNHQKFWIIDEQKVRFSTGNWSPSDYPGGTGSYPPYGSNDWQSVNRDFTVGIEDPTVVDIFSTVLTQDLKNSSIWYPKTNTTNSFVLV